MKSFSELFSIKREESGSYVTALIQWAEIYDAYAARTLIRFCLGIRVHIHFNNSRCFPASLDKTEILKHIARARLHFLDRDNWTWTTSSDNPDRKLQLRVKVRSSNDEDGTIAHIEIPWATMDLLITTPWEYMDRLHAYFVKHYSESNTLIDDMVRKEDVKHRDTLRGTQPRYVGMTNEEDEKMSVMNSAFITIQQTLHFPASGIERATVKKADTYIPWDSINTKKVVAEFIGPPLCLTVLHEGSEHLPHDLDLNEHIKRVHELATKLSNWSYNFSYYELFGEEYPANYLILGPVESPLGKIGLTNQYKEFGLTINELIVNIAEYFRSFKPVSSEDFEKEFGEYRGMDLVDKVNSHFNH